MIIVSASTFAFICLIVLMIALGGANAVGGFIAANMTTILVVISILYIIRLVILSYRSVIDSELGVPSKVISIFLQLAESIFAVFTCYKALLYLVICVEEKGFFGFGIELVLWALLIVTPLLGGTAIGTLLSWDLRYVGVPVSSVCYLISYFLSSNP